MKGLRAKQNLKPQVTMNLRLRFFKAYFGDGTGFEAEGDWRETSQAKVDPRKRIDLSNSADGLISFIERHHESSIS